MTTMMDRLIDNSPLIFKLKMMHYYTLTGDVPVALLIFYVLLNPSLDAKSQETYLTTTPKRLDNAHSCACCQRIC